MQQKPKIFTFLTIHPEFISAYLSFGVFRSAIDKKLLQVEVVNLRDFAIDQRGSVDDTPYGGGDGMVMRPEPLAHAVEAILAKNGAMRVVHLSPTGKTWHHEQAQSFADSSDSYIFVCGRFGGIDQRFIDKFVDIEVSVGDFIVSGGELAALTVSDSILRLIPHVLGHTESANRDSFAEGFSGGLEHPLYTRPPVFRDAPVPEVLRSGNHKAIAAWQKAQSQQRTQDLRPDLILS